VQVMGEDDENGDAADSVELWDLLSHRRRQRPNARTVLNVDLLAYVSILRGEKGQIEREQLQPTLSIS
jgi:hypothetical protein